MKHLFFLLAIVLTIGANAQVSNPYPYAEFGYMPNLSNTHPNATLDTVSATTAYFTTGKYQTNGMPVKNPTFGTGTISFVVSALKAQTTTTVSPTVVITPQMSFDGNSNSWANVPSVTVATLTPTSATVPVTTAYTFSANYAPYYRMKITTTDTASVKNWFYNNKATSNQK